MGTRTLWANRPRLDVFAAMVLTVAACVPADGRYAGRPPGSSGLGVRSSSSMPVAYPPTRRDPVSDTRQGLVADDPYRWLERADDPDVRRWLAGQEALRRDMFAGIPLRQSIKEQLEKLLYAGRLGKAPRRGGTRAFFTLQKPGQEKAVLYVRERADGLERAIIEPESMGRGGAPRAG